MSDAARNLSSAELEALTRRLNARVPRDPSAIAPKASADVISMRRAPLGLRPIVDPDDEPEGEERDEVMSEARSAEMIAWRAKSPGGNRSAFLSDIDILIERALKDERKHTSKFVFPIIGEVIGELQNELQNDLRKQFADGQAKVAALEASLADLRVQLAELRGAAAERQRAQIIRP